MTGFVCSLDSYHLIICCSEIPSRTIKGQAWWSLPVIPGIGQEAEVRGLWSKEGPDNSMRPYLKNELKVKRTRSMAQVVV
jgi:hypothetical protein